MKWQTKILFLFPVVALIGELVWFINNPRSIPPKPRKNPNIQKIFELLSTAKITPLNVTVSNASQETHFIIKNPNQSLTKIVLSTQKNPYAQVNALQKLIKIANIKGQSIQFIDLASSRPYATL